MIVSTATSQFWLATSKLPAVGSVMQQKRAQSEREGYTAYVTLHVLCLAGCDRNSDGGEDIYPYIQ